MSGPPPADSARAGALARSEERLQLMIDAVQDYAIFMIDPDGIIISWNAGAERINGYGAGEAIGQHIRIFYTQEARLAQHPEEELRLAKQAGRYEEEGFRVRKDGTRFWANVVISAVYDHQGTHLGFTKITRDFSERKAAEERLRLSEERFRILVGSVHEYAIFMLSPDGHILSWNAGAQRLKGYSAQEIIGQHFSIFYPEEERRRDHPGHELRLAREFGAYSEEGWRLRKDGSRFWASVVITALEDDHGQHIGFAKVTRDMTERRRTEELLRQSEERLRLLIESVRDYAIFMLDRTGHVATWNAGAEAIKGYRAEEILGKHFSIFYPPEARSAGLPERELQIAEREGRYEEEGERVRKDGTRIWVNVVLTAIREPGTGALRGFAKITRDLTERQKLEEQARKAAELAGMERVRTAEAQEALRLRDEFISVAAHELRTPLAALSLKVQALELAMRREAGEAAQPLPADRLAGARRQVQRLGDLVERLLDVSRIVRGHLALQREPIDLTSLARRVLEDFREQAQQAGCKVQLQSPGPVLGSWDPVRLEQVLTNLLSNALRYGAGKPIEVRLEATPLAVRLDVIDQGAGIGAADLERIFRRFERASSIQHYGGLGLGLFVTRSLVEAHGGTITATSELGRGSRFTVLLPRELPASRPDTLSAR